LTGGKQKVANYPGVTVERKEGRAFLPNGSPILILDLPGAYSLEPHTPDEAVARDALLGKLPGEPAPDLVIAVVDTTHLERNLGLVLEIRSLGIPTVLALNMADLARYRGMELDLEQLSRELGMPVVPTVAPRREGLRELLAQVEAVASMPRSFPEPSRDGAEVGSSFSAGGVDAVRARFVEVDRIIKSALKKSARPELWTDRIDRVLLHPIAGFVVLIAVLALVFQAIFNWSQLPAELIERGLGALAEAVTGALPAGPLRSLLVDGVLAGVGSVLVFLPQILLLFLFILVLEDSGYMARAAFLMDRLMRRVGLHGRAFIPLLSSFACAIPGIMATRTIENPRDRLTTILVAPLMTCSARLPVYSLLIGAFVPDRPVMGPLRLQGLVMLALYLLGVFTALLVAWALKRLLFRGTQPPLLMELPSYKLPSFTGIALGLAERARVFVRRAGTVILTLMVVLWFLSSHPGPPGGATEPAIFYSFAGKIGRFLEPVFAPIGFDWRISVALIPGFAAREVMVGALATVYAVEAGEGGGEMLERLLPGQWSVATALSLLVWYVLAMQCISTLAVARRETNSWRWPLFLLGYMTVLAYSGSFFVYNTARFLGL
jgi:ferrous iron transport protein B